MAQSMGEGHCWLNIESEPKHMRVCSIYMMRNLLRKEALAAGKPLEDSGEELTAFLNIPQQEDVLRSKSCICRSRDLCRKDGLGLRCSDMSQYVTEKKLTAHHLDEQRAEAIVSHFCVPHPVYPEGWINSIYFDTSHFVCLKEKIEGDRLKRKYRLRWYDADQDAVECPAFLEIKFRCGSVRDKVRNQFQLPLEWLGSVPLEDPSLLCMLYEAAATFPENIPLGLYPILCISYHRKRYLCMSTGVTICIDSGIHVTRVNSYMLPHTAPFSIQTTVVEFKDVQLPEIYWFRHLYHAGFRLRSFSKYGECMNQIQYGCAPTVMRMSI
jgi:hypothetical protein